MDDDVEDGDEPHTDVGKVDGEGLLARRSGLSSTPCCCSRCFCFSYVRSGCDPRRESLGEVFVEIQVNLVELKGFENGISKKH